MRNCLECKWCDRQIIGPNAYFGCMIDHWTMGGDWLDKHSAEQVIQAIKTAETCEDFEREEK